MGKVLSFGELLLRISPDTNGNWLKTNKLPFYTGGAEANVAAALALWNVPSAYLSALPDNYLSHELVSYLGSLGIDTSRMHYSGERIGIYYLPEGGELKSTGVIYDRNHSSFATLKPGLLDWDSIFKDVSWFHFSAICPALNPNAVAVCEEALKAAASRDITISLDLNYRAKLWQYGKAPGEVMPLLARHCHVLMGNIWAAEKMLNIPFEAVIDKGTTKEEYLQQAEKTSKAILNAYPECHTIANTFRFEQDGELSYYTTLYRDNQFCVSKPYRSATIVNKIGSGDCFMAGLIYSALKQSGSQQMLEFATAAAFVKLFTESDFSTANVVTIEQYLSGDHG